MQTQINYIMFRYIQAVELPNECWPIPRQVARIDSCLVVPTPRRKRLADVNPVRDRVPAASLRTERACTTYTALSNATPRNDHATMCTNGRATHSSACSQSGQVGPCCS